MTTEPPPEPPRPFLDGLRRAHEMRLWKLETAPQPVIDEEFEEIAEEFQVTPKRRYPRGGVRGPFEYHPPLPANAPRWRKALRYIYTQANIVLFGLLP